MRDKKIIELMEQLAKREKHFTTLVSSAFAARWGRKDFYKGQSNAYSICREELGRLVKNKPIFKLRMKYRKWKNMPDRDRLRTRIKWEILKFIFFRHEKA